MTLRVIVLAVATTFTALAFQDAPKLTAADIMRRVAENQDREQRARTQFVYEEIVHRTMRRKDGKLLREEFRTYSVTPGAKGNERKLVSVKGRYWHKGKYTSFEGEPVPQGGLLQITLDDDEDSQQQTRDGIDKDLFPLTSDEQRKYVFELTGERVVRERNAYQIKFGPVDRHD